MIILDHVSMQYPVPRRIRAYFHHPFTMQRVTALHDVSLDIAGGERVAFLGPNGAGKTTLLKLIGGLLLPTRGRVTVNGYDTLVENMKAKRLVGLVFNEERSFFWRLTGLQNLEFFGALDNLVEPDLRRRIEELVSLVGLNGHLQKPVGGYSSGMKQRLAIARGLLSDPNILVLDEPTRTLDPIAADALVDLIRDRITPSKTLLLATHRLDRIVSLCDKVCIINEGRIIAYRNTSDILAESESMTAFYRSSILKALP